MLTSSPVALALGLEKASSDIMRSPPRPPGTTLFTREFNLDTMVYGFLLGTPCLMNFLITVYVETSGEGFSIIKGPCDYAQEPESHCGAILVGR